ncbi:MAG: hypothetical protein AB7I27_09310 [Bacteriovoracaceae bacterium]
MKKFLLAGLMLSTAAFAESFTCVSMGGLGDLLCIGAKHRAKKCAMRDCQVAGYGKCKVVYKDSYRTDFHPLYSCRAEVTVLGTNRY